MAASRMQGRVVLITGAAGGIGSATALCMAREGASLMLVDANGQALEAAVAALCEALPTARVASLAADVADKAAAQEAVRHSLEAFGHLDALVNNAAMRNYSSTADVTADEWHALVDVNLVGITHYCQAAMPHLRASGRGSVVNVSSCYAVTGRKGMALYDATKAAQLSFTRTLAFEEAAHGVRVNAVCPGSTLTGFHVARAERMGKSVEQLRTERKTTSLIGRWAEPQEVAWPILWLTSDEASFITGTTLMVDGGLHIM